MSNISALNNKPINNSMKLRILIGQFGFIFRLIIPSTETSKIFSSFRCEIGKQLEYNSTSSLCPYLNIHINFWIGFRTHIDNYIRGRNKLFDVGEGTGVVVAELVGVIVGEPVAVMVGVMVAD